VTGDAERTARAVAERLAIGSVQARLTPVGKQHGVAEAQARGDVVAVVGDGVNDAPALARADVGIAMGGGAGAAIESAPVTLLGGDLRALPDLFQLSRLTLRTIRQNLFWAFAYNVAGIPVAAGLGAAFAAIVGASNPLDFLLPPVFAAIAMTFSSLLVLVNSLRLARAPLTRPGR
jgi:Cu+-exporting ATPase